MSLTYSKVPLFFDQFIRLWQGKGGARFVGLNDTVPGLPEHLRPTFMIPTAGLSGSQITKGLVVQNHGNLP